MNRNYFLLCLFGILACFVAGSVARTAIIGGKEANSRNFRYMVSLFEVNYGHICGGAILNTHFVLTAAHCFVNYDNSFKNQRVLARMGTTNLQQSDEPAVIVEVVKVYVPTEYNATDINTTGDIAVLKLKLPFHVRNYGQLKTVSLERNQRDNHVGQKAVIAGWGSHKVYLQNHEPLGHRIDSLLRYTNADVLTHQQCQQEYPILRIYSEHLCARSEQHDYEVHSVCHGDDGSPLVLDGYVIGVLSKFSNYCAERANAAIYTRVSHYLTFIRNAKSDYVTEVMRAHEFQP